MQEQVSQEQAPHPKGSLSQRGPLRPVQDPSYLLYRTVLPPLLLPKAGQSE